MPRQYYNNLPTEDALYTLSRSQEEQAQSHRRKAAADAAAEREKELRDLGKKKDLTEKQFQIELKLLDDKHQQRIKHIDDEYERETKNNKKLLDELKERADLEKKNWEIASKTVDEKLKMAQSDAAAIEANIRLNNLLIEQNKNKLQQVNLSAEDREIFQKQLDDLDAKNKIEEKKLRESEEYSRKAKQAKIEIDNFRQPSGSPVFSDKKQNEQLQNYYREQFALFTQRKHGIISEEEYKRQSKLLKDALDPAVERIVNKMDNGEAGSLFSGKHSGLSSVIKAVTSAVNTIGKILNEGFKTLDKSVDDAVSVYTNYNAKITSRLYGDTNNTTFSDLLSDIREDVKASPFVNQKKLIDNLSTLANEGINYNLEQRALLLTLNDRLVPTFDALDGTFQRMIRLQQSDITWTQMGAEAKILELLNGTFKDSSYLNSMYKSVSGAISDALSTQLDTDQYTQFAFTIQKWLGALYSVGMSDTAIGNIASALNLLATGDVNQLGESPAQTLLAFSSQRAGLSYADLLTQGLTASDTDKLLKSMVEYLKSIANNTSSKVVKSQWGDILNLQMSDWKAIQNLTDFDIDRISSTNINQQSANETLNTLITNYLPARTHLSERVSNAVDNALVSFGMSVASDTTPDILGNKYAQWQIMRFIRNMGSTLGGGEGLLSKIGSALGSIGSLILFAPDLATMGMDLTDGLLGGTDNSILNAFARSGFSYTMDRGGGVVIDPTRNSSAQRSISESSSAIVIPSDLDRMRINEEEDYYVVPDVVAGIRSTGKDAMLTNFHQQEATKSATLENVINNENIMSRDINDLFSELFEKQTTPIRVAIAKIEDAGKMDMSSALSGLGVNVLNEDIFYQLADMRS